MQMHEGNQSEVKQEGITIITEGNKELILQGKAKIHTKYIQKNQQNQIVENEVFYNPVQIFNRDFTVAVMQQYINDLKQQKGEKFEGVKIIDALSASGLRTVRFLKELEGVQIVYANDISPASHKLMKDNFELNGLDPKKYKMTMEDANLLLQQEKKDNIFDILDLDPYGSAVPFLDAAVEGVRDGGLLCITCTDLKVTCGPDLAKCYYYYGTTRAKVQHYNENALRIVLSTISSTASRHCKFIEPLVSFQTDFYLRVFVIVRKGRKESAESATKIGNVYNCNQCGNYEYQPFFVKKTTKTGYAANNKLCSSVNCTVCGNSYHLNGPIWLSNMNNFAFIQRLITNLQKPDYPLTLKTSKKIYGTLFSILEQKNMADVPLGFSFQRACKKVKSTTPAGNVLVSAVESLGKGYSIVPSYVSPGFYKSNAGMDVIYDVIKCWKKKDMPEDKYLSNVKDDFGIAILKKEIVHEPDFEFKAKKMNKVPKFISMGKGMGPKGKPLQRVLDEAPKQ